MVPAIGAIVLQYSREKAKDRRDRQWASRKVQVVLVCTTKERPKAERQEAIKDMKVYTRTWKKKPTGCKD